MKVLLPLLFLLAVSFACTESRPVKQYSVTEPLVSEKVDIAPREWRSFPFKITEKGSRVNGSFNTGTDKSYPVMFYVTDPESAVTLKEKNVGSYNFRSVDSKGSIYSGSILKELDPGNYVFLFHNESDSEQRTVNITMFVER